MEHQGNRMQDARSESPERALKVLERLSERFARSPDEHAALELAAKALLFATERGARQAFSEFVKTSGAELSEGQKKMLREMGMQTEG